ncbi:MAG: class I SAM-dependent methyltransferase [Betaproteobacteria bacterium]|nr:class I SAM-dependent methyltransferase [Betaproteobacteria bacterium]
MNRRLRWLGLLALVTLDCAAFAQGPVEDVPFVPTPQSVVEAMLKLAQVRPRDFVIDLGSGDGRIVITAARQFGAEGLGIEYDEALLERATKAAAEAGVADRVTFIKQDLFQTDLSQATVLTLYLLPEVNLALRPKILEQLRPGARVVSHDWDMGDWEPDAKIEVDAPDKEVGAQKKSTVFLWVVPARVEGAWRSRLGAGGELELELKQKYQHVTGTVRYRNVECPVAEATLSGDRLAIRACEERNRLLMVGKVHPDRIVGMVSRGGAPRTQFRALRDKPDAFPSFR